MSGCNAGSDVDLLKDMNIVSVMVTKAKDMVKEWTSPVVSLEVKA